MTTTDRISAANQTTTAAQAAANVLAVRAGLLARVEAGEALTAQDALALAFALARFADVAI